MNSLGGGGEDYEKPNFSRPAQRKTIRPILIVWVLRNPKGVKRMLSLSPVIQSGMHVISLGFCFRVIVNEKSLFKKTTSSVLSLMLLIYEVYLYISCIADRQPVQ